MLRSDVSAFADKASETAGYCRTEEATKLALILPLIRLLGYPTDDPTVVIPEYGTDEYTRADFAIMVEGGLFAIIEAKSTDVQLPGCRKQLQGYFDHLRPSIGILTNGMKYEFFSSSNSTSMDKEPFFEFSLDTLSVSDISVLEQFASENVKDHGGLAALEMANAILRVSKWLDHQFSSIDDDLVKFILNSSLHTQTNRSLQSGFAPLVQQALTDIVQSKAEQIRIEESTVDQEEQETRAVGSDVSAMEIECFYVIRTLVAEWTGIDPERIRYTARKTYCVISIDDTWLCKFLFGYKNNKQVWMHCNRQGDAKGLDVSEYKFPIKRPSDIRLEKEWIITTVKILNV